MRWIHGAALLAACSVAAQPCRAAQDARDAVVRGRMGAFAGVGFTLPFGTSGHRSPRATLQLGPTLGLYDARSGALLRTTHAAGLELGATRRGALSFSMGGNDQADLKRKLGLHGTTGYIVIGGVLVLVVLLAAVASASPKPGPRPGDF